MIKPVFNLGKRSSGLARLLILLLLLLTTYFILYPSGVNSQVVINELGVKDLSEDWVEFYNYGVEPINLETYKLRDESGNEKILSGIIEASSIKVLEDWSNRLNNSGDIVWLIDISGVEEIIVEEIVYGDKGGVCVPEDSLGSIGKASDGGNTLVRFSVASENASNEQGTILACPTPTPDPTTRPTSTLVPAANNPTSTPTIRATPKPTPKPTATPKKTLKPTPTETSNEEDEVLGASEEEESPTPSPEEESDETSRPFPIIPIILIVAGVGLIIGALFYYFKTAGVSFKIRKGDKNAKTKTSK